MRDALLFEQIGKKKSPGSGKPSGDSRGYLWIRLTMKPVHSQPMNNRGQAIQLCAPAIPCERYSEATWKLNCKRIPYPCG